MNQPDTANDASIKRIGGLVVQVAGPALAMVVVYSIAAFLIEICYHGPWVGRLKWIFFLFSFAAVLISRISIEEGFERATVFGFFLGLAIVLTVSRFVEGSLILLAGILTFVWWSAGRLTWDCTFIDKSRDATGQGMIDLVIDRVNRFRKGQPVDEYRDPDLDLPPDPDLVQGETPRAQENPGVWDRFVAIFWRRKQANTPGLWAFCFLLMGLPLFGFGQLMLRMTDDVGHQAAAVHFFFYVTGLLGLLMLSSVLGLHRYLQKNQSSMPGNVARKWIVAGTVLAIGITGFCFLLPRPTAQYSIGHWLPKLASRDTEPSDTSFGNDGQEKSDNNSNVNSGPQSRDDRASKDDQNEDAGTSGNERKGDQGSPKDTKGGKSAGGKSSDGKKGSGGEKKQGSKSNSQQKQGEQKGDSNQSGEKGKRNQGNQGQKSKQGEQQSGKNSEKKSGDPQSSDDKSKKKTGLKTRNERNQSRSQKDKKKNGSRSSSRQRSSKPRESSKNRSQKKQKQDTQKSESSTGLWAAIQSFIKLLVWIAALITIAWFAIRHRDKILPWIQSFIAEMLDFWRRLWNREKKPKSTTAPEIRKSGKQVRLPGFAQFNNPFASETAKSWTPDRLVTYTFEAFEAWSRDHQCAREPEQTAHEFAYATVQRYESLKKDATYLAGLYSQLAYARGTISRSAAMALSPLWEKLTMMYAPEASGQTG